MTIILLVFLGILVGMAIIGLCLISRGLICQVMSLMAGKTLKYPRGLKFVRLLSIVIAQLGSEFINSSTQKANFY